MKQAVLMSLTALCLLVGSVHADEHGEKDANNAFMKADANNDGRVSFDEYKAAHEARLKARFERRDINKDGFIDMDEKKVAKQKRKEKVKAAKQEDRKALREQYREERKRRKKHFNKYN